MVVAASERHGAGPAEPRLNPNPLTDDAVREDPSLNYGRIRLWGSLAFLLCNIGAGYMLASTPADAVIIALILISLTAAAISIRAPARAVRSEPGTPRPPPRPLPAALVWFIAGGALLQGSHATVYGFGSIEWRAQGISESVIGWLWAIGVIAEVILFWLIGRGVGRGADSRILMLMGAGCGIDPFHRTRAHTRNRPSPSCCRSCTASLSERPIWG